MKRLALRPRADADLVVLTRWNSRQGGLQLAGRFFDAAHASAQPIAAEPGIGQIIGMKGLRSWPLKRFPIRWFYIEQSDHVDVIRLLGERQALAAILPAQADSPAAD